MKRIVVLAAESQDALDRRGADCEDTQCDTIKEAQRRAKYFLTEEYMSACESTTRMGYSQVLVNGECHSDYFGKGC